MKGSVMVSDEQFADETDPYLVRPTGPRMVRAPSRAPKVTHFIFTHALGKVWLLGVLAGAFAALVHELRNAAQFDVGFPHEALLTFAVGLMLSVRVAKAYDRWWEARIKWGKLVNISRNWAIKVRELAKPSYQERRIAHRLIQGFCRSLKHHLRGGAAIQTVRGFGKDEENPKHVPAHIAGRIYAMQKAWVDEGRMSDTEHLVIDAEARELLEVAGACERIYNTPMSPSFRAFVRFGILLLLISLPFELSAAVGWLVVPSMVLAAFLLCGGESIAHSLEHPFGIYTDDLDLEAYCDGIDRVTAEILSVKDYASPS